MNGLSLYTYVKIARAIHLDNVSGYKPPEAGGHSKTDLVVIRSLTKGTRGYIEKISTQVNGAYENGYYDACAVMIRRLLETLIIECYESFGISQRIKNQSGDFLYLSDLIDLFQGEDSWNISRNAKKALKNLKLIGDKSAHSRRFVAQRRDIEGIFPDIRDVVQELIYIAKLEKSVRK